MVQEELDALVDKYLVEIAGVPKDKLADRTLRMGELGIDSLGVVEMLFEIEDRYGFHIEDAMKYKDMTLGEVIADLVRLIEQRDAKAGAQQEPQPASPQAPDEQALGKAGA